MARGKNAPALFEVIRNAQEKQRQQDLRLKQQREAAGQSANSSGGDAASPARPPITQRLSSTVSQAGTSAGATASSLLQTPLFWFKGKGAAKPAEPVMREVARPPVREEAPAARETVQPPVADTAAETFVAEPKAPAQAPAPAYRPAIAEYARQIRQEIAAGDEDTDRAPAAEPLFDSRKPARKFAEPAGSDSARPAAGSDIKIDHDHRQINLRLTYTSAIVTGFAVVVACGLAYLVGTTGRSKTTTVAESTPQPGVIDVSPSKQPAADSGNTGGETKPVQPKPQGLANIPENNDTNLDNGGGPVAIPTNVQRIVGWQYLVPMSFLRKADADGLVKFLADNGIAATAEKRPDWSATYYLVITTRGFDHVSKNPKYDVFLASLNKVMQKYSRNSNYAAGKPNLYTWKTP